MVGPNGSGKSNIFDAIRWVLGETSAKSLRGGSMKDVIFSGCDTRKASSSAQVSLEFDNTKRVLPKLNDDTVIITRKAHINGKSEYFINHQPARLRDIQDLFLDTGLGSNSYSMIGQEQTKKLLSEKTEERRAIFEEAAGIVKMKNQKETTEKRLEEVEQDFIRLTDIFKELEKQFKPLQKQSEKAKRYVSIKEILDKTETEFLSYKYQRLHNEDIDVSKNLQEKNNKLDAAVLNVEELEIKLKELKLSLKSVNDHLLIGQDNKSKLKEEIDTFETQIRINEERIYQAEIEINEVSAEIKEIEEKFSVSVEEFNSKKERYQELDRLVFQNRERKNELDKEIFRSQIDITVSKEKMETLREEITSLYNEFQEAKLRFEQHNREEEQILSNLDTLKKKKKSYENDLNEAENNTIHYKEKFDSNTTKIQKLNTEYQLCSKQHNEYQKDLEQITSQLFKVETTLAKERATLDSLESSLENFEGYYEGVRNILKNKQQLSGVLDVVSNLFSLKNGYELALDSLLSPVAQNIVVDSVQNAKKAVNFLKEKKYGRATFIPLNDLSSRTLSIDELDLISKYEGISSALTVIEYEKHLEPLFRHLLGRFLIATDMESAVTFYEKTRIKTKIVTLDGDILQPGTISGGTKNKKGLISKRKEIDVLRGNMKKNNIILQKTKEQDEKIRKQISVLNQQKNTLAFSLEEVKESHNQYQLELERTLRNFEQAKNKAKEKEITEKDLKYRYDESKKISSSLFTKHREKEHLHKIKNEELTDIIRFIKVSEEELENKKHQETLTLIDIEKFEEEKRNLTEFISEQENGKVSFEKRLEFLQAKKFSNESKLDVARKENQQNQKNTEHLKEHFSVIESEIESKYKEKDGIQNDMDNTELTLSSFRTNLENLKNDVHNLDLQKTKIDHNKAQIINRAKDAYRLDEVLLLQFETEEINESEKEKEIKSLLNEIKLIGTVNLASIKDFTELNERYQREKTQLEDVKEAKKDLESLLRDVSLEMTDRFNITFKEVAKHFEKTFVELFGGGQAKLSLEDPKKPLTSHILISAQPPGKKPKRMEFLSGGEKNLTSCALIFAIIKAKPSPFVYLDEIDAPLDDANVSRFAYYLKKLSEKTQFIVVTHRKGTMMAADSLFGVTQEELGITTVFPYHLNHEDFYFDDDEKAVQ